LFICGAGFDPEKPEADAGPEWETVMAKTEISLLKQGDGARESDDPSPGTGQFALAGTIQKTLGVFQARMGEAPMRMAIDPPAGSTL
jgi:hypothetical protein